jgi:hypothetical protein
MQEQYKVTYLHSDGSIRVKSVYANSADEARSLVYDNTTDCIQTYCAE